VISSKKRFLLDTQAFLLAADPTAHFSSKIRALLLSTENFLYLSLVSVWEMQIKIGLKKLSLPVGLPEAIQAGVSQLGIELLPLQVEHIYQLSDLPLHHRDPFDRLLIAQALCEKLTIIGGDSAFDKYKVDRIW